MLYNQVGVGKTQSVNAAGFVFADYQSKVATYCSSFKDIFLMKGTLGHIMFISTIYKIIYSIICNIELFIYFLLKENHYLKE